jgi:type IV pilus assembly protein PilA
MKFFTKQMNKKGFSLIELIVVIAILAIIAAVAIPRFAGIQDRSTVKSDGATAAEILNAARVQHVDNNLITLDPTGTAVAGTSAVWSNTYMTWPTPQGGGTFVLSYAGDVYTVTWTPTNCGAHNVVQDIDEGEAFSIN